MSRAILIGVGAVATLALFLPACGVNTLVPDSGSVLTDDTGDTADVGDGGHTRPCAQDTDCPSGLACRTHLCVPPVTVDGGPLDGGPTTPDASPLDGGVLDSGPVTPDGGCHGPQKLEVSPATVEFGVVTAGCSSKDVQVTLKNTGCHDLPVLLISIVPITVSMRIASAPPMPFPITGGSERIITLRYHPQISNGSETATLHIEWDDGTKQAVNEVPLQGAAERTADVIDTYRQDPLSEGDLLWCVDTSAGMGVFQKLMADSFSMFGTDRLYPPMSDLQIGIITSEIDGPQKLASGDWTYPGVLFSKTGMPRVIANVQPDPLPPALDPVPRTEAEFIADFQANSQTGDCCPQTRKGCLEAIKMALSPPNVSDPQKNGGLLREGIPLAIVVVSNADDDSPEAVKGYADFIQSLERDVVKAQVSVAVVGGFSGDGQTGQLPQARACDKGNGPVKAATRYLDLLQQVKSGFAFTLCRDDWANLMWMLGGKDQGGFCVAVQFFLSRWPDPATIVVKVNGKVVASDPVNGWTYDPTTNSIIFGSAVVVTYESAIEVAYHVACY